MNKIKRQFNEVVNQKIARLPKALKKSSFFDETVALFKSYLAVVE
jgi:hypothetical protein